MKKKIKYSKESLRRISKNLRKSNGLCPSLTANAMQSVNHQNCVLIIEEEEK